MPNSREIIKNVVPLLNFKLQRLQSNMEYASQIVLIENLENVLIAIIHKAQKGAGLKEKLVLLRWQDCEQKLSVT